MRRRWSILTAVFAAILLIALSFDAAPFVAASPAHLDLRQYPVVPVIAGNVAARARYLVRLGRRYGNRANVFSKIGDSITDWGYFLAPVGTGGLRLANHGELQDVVNWFSPAMARTNNSFANISLAARGHWTARTLIEPDTVNPDICRGLSPVACELSVVRPAVALIMIGTNDLADGDVNAFSANLNRVVTIVESYGVIPVVSTIPYRRDNPDVLGRVDAYNEAIIRVALAHNAPIWNYWLAIVDLPGNGVSTDNVHPSVPPDQNTAIFDDFHLQYGFTMRNLTALQVLNSLLPVLR
jgi:hypothetical protein